MKRVAVFGNAGGGKSTLARELAAITGLPLAVVDELQYRAGGMKVPHQEYLQVHASLLAQDEWIIDGFGGIDLLWERLEAADTLIHVDLPLAVHALWVTKRLVKGLFSAPQGWPRNSPIISSSISSYRVLWPCHTRLTPKYRSYISEAAQRKRVFRLRSGRELTQFLASMRTEHAQRNREVSMTSFALIVKHKTQPGKRDEVRKVWEKHMASAVAANPGHTAYFYCFDNSDPDSICAFQQYSSAEASQAFLKTDSYAAYLVDVEPLLAGPPQVTALTPVWSKEA